MEQEPATYSDEQRHEAVALRAYQLWEERGRPSGSPELDWFAAENELRATHHPGDQHEAPTVAAAKVVGSMLGSVAGLVTSIVDSLHAGSES